ncbi:transient receptor potential cation channel subfamily A member 1-like [Dysidea avara]|uniref:transient receptor potential cation channel subfamily A member 1-like n=1 Tax=Dysidea avara TaxID=196820 RepID=UPI00331ADD5B
MTTGELDFDGIFFNSQEDAEEGNDLFYPHIAYFLWIVFIIIMPILLSNLLTGLAVGDVNEIQAAAELKILALTVDFTLRFEEIPYFHKRCRKPFDTEKFSAGDDRDLLRNKSYKDPLWNRFIRFILYKNKKNIDDDVSSTGSLDYVQTEISQLKVLINEQNKQQDILLQFVKKTNSKLDLVTKRLDLVTEKQEELFEEFKSCKQSGSGSDSDSDSSDEEIKE